MHIHIDRRQTLPKIPKLSLAICRGQILQETRSYIQYLPIVLDAKNRRLPTLEKSNLDGATSRRYAKSSIYHIFVWNLVRWNSFAYLFRAVLCV
jgi:hypothetical protein